MKRLVAFPQTGGNGVELDAQEASIEWSMSATDMSKPQLRTAPHSLNFSLPFTHTNNKFFNHWYEVNVDTNTWSHDTKTNVIVYDGLDEVFDGVLQLISVNTFREEYECFILSASANFYTSIRGMTWRELLTEGSSTSSILDHIITTQTMEDSWNTSNDITLGAGNGTIVYCIADNAEFTSTSAEFADHTFMTFYGLVSTATIFVNITPIRPRYMRPMVKVVWVINYIFQKVGFTFQSSFLSSPEVDKLYMTLATEEVSMPIRALYSAKVRAGASINPMTSEQYENLNFTYEVGDYYDPDNLVSGGGFVAPANGTYSLAVYVNWTSATAPATPQLYTAVRALVGVVPFVATANASVDNSGPLSVTMQYNFTLDLSAGDSVSFLVKHSSGASNPYYVDAVGTYLELTSYVTDTGVLDAPAAFPDITIDKWFRAIVAEFNLAVVASTEYANHLIIEPFTDYYNNYGTTKNWTQKIDLDKDIVLRPTTDEQKKRITFEDAEGKDFRNDWWQTNFGWVKGRKRYDNTNEFAVGEENVGGVFAPFRLSPIPINFTIEDSPNVPFLVLRLYTKEKGRVKSQTSPPMLAFYHGLKDIGFPVYVEGGTQITQYPFFSHMSDAPATSDSINLRWGYDYPDHGEHPYLGMSGNYKYRNYYAQQLAATYGRDARIVECNAWLTASDVRSLSFADKIFIKDAYYRLYELNNFLVGDARASRLKLLKVLDTTSYTCGSYPIAWSANGQVVFADSETGSVVPATALCCIAADYTWDDAQGVCLWNADNGVGGGVVVTDADDGTGVTNTGNPNVPQGPNGYETEVSDPATGLVGSVGTFGVYGVTSSATTQILQTATGQQIFSVPNDAVISLDVQATTYQYGGTGGTLGTTSSVNQQFLIDTTNNLARVVSSSVVNSENVVRSLSVTLVNSGVPTLSIAGVGANNVDLYWFASVEVVGMIIPELGTEDEHAEDIQFNGSNSEFMVFNGGVNHAIYNG